MSLSFSKYQGLGNDFILINAKDFPPKFDFTPLATQLCQRNFGIGADGLIVHFNHPLADAEMQIWNADGSQPEMCGNGLRCFVQYLADTTQPLTEYKIQTGAGLLKAQLNSDNTISVNMGPPHLSSDIPKKNDDNPYIEQAVAGTPFQITAVSMGNPHCVIFVPNLEAVNFEKWGPYFESHTLFPKKTNVEFVEVKSPKQAQVKVWERGVGPTLACGTGACAVLVAGVQTQKLDTSAQIKLPGGTLEIEWNPPGDVIMKGPAERVFNGNFLLENLL